MVVDSGGEGAPTAQARNFRKRRTPADEEADDDALLPAAAAMKRRRLEEEADARRRGVSTDHHPSRHPTKSPTPAPKPGKKKKAPVDIEKAVRERRQAQEAAADGDADGLPAVDDMTVDEMKRLAVVEELDVPTRPPAHANGTAKTDRWDARWNGRKNFKRFRRKGEAAPRRGQTVMVPLEPAFTSGDRQRQKAEQERSWRESIKSLHSSGRRRRRALPKEEDDDVDEEEDDVEAERTTFASAQSHLDENDEVEVPGEFVPESGQHVVEVTAKAPRPAGRKETEPAAGAKRAATKGTKGKPAKRQRVYDSDSGDSMQFQYQEDSSDEEG